MFFFQSENPRSFINRSSPKVLPKKGWLRGRVCRPGFRCCEFSISFLKCCTIFFLGGEIPFMPDPVLPCKDLSMWNFPHFFASNPRVFAWRIIPVRKWLVTPIYKRFRLFGREPTYLGDLPTMVINHWKYLGAHHPSIVPYDRIFRCTTPSFSLILPARIPWNGPTMNVATV